MDTKERPATATTVSEVHDAFDAAKEARARVRELVNLGEVRAAEAIFEVAHAFHLAADRDGPVTELSNDLAAIINGEA